MISDDIYGAALNLPMCHRVFDDLFGGGSFYDGLKQRLIFFEHFLRIVIVLASLYLPFNKCATPARLALSHRRTKMFLNTKIQKISLIKINELSDLYYCYLC